MDAARDEAYLGARVWDELKRRGSTVVWLAAAAQLRPRRLYELKMGLPDRHWTYEEMVAVARALGKSPRTLFGRAGRPCTCACHERKRARPARSVKPLARPVPQERAAS